MEFSIGFEFVGLLELELHIIDTDAAIDTEMDMDRVTGMELRKEPLQEPYIPS